MKKYGPLLIIFAGMCWGGIGVFVRFLNDFGVNTMQIVWLRALVGTIIIAAVTLITDRTLFKIKLRHIWCMAGSAIVGIIFFNYCYFETIEAASLSVAVVLLYTAPIFVMIISSFLFGEAITVRKISCMAAAFLGCMMVSGVFSGSAVLTVKGLFIGICSGLGYAMYTIFVRYALNYGYEPLTIQFYTFLIGTIAGAFMTDFGQIEAALETGNFKVVILTLCIGFLCTALPNVLYNTGMKYVDNGKTSIMAAMEPVMAIVLGIVIFHEIPGVLSCIGIILVLVAIVLINRE